MERRCDRCEWWIKLDHMGFCHRYPPQVLPNYERDLFPLVKKDDWCGEFKESGQSLDKAWEKRRDEEAIKAQEAWEKQLKESRQNAEDNFTIRT